MSEAWIAIGICVVLVLGAAIPLLKDHGSHKAPPPPPKETQRDWRNDQ